MEQVAKLLGDLAKQLGTTVEFLWCILIRQAHVEATLALAGVVIGAVLLVIGVWTAIVAIKKYKEHEDVDDAFPYFVISGLAWIASTGTLSVNIYNYISISMNPEYWALNKILSMF